MEWNTVERAIKTDTRTQEKGVGKIGWFLSKTSTVTSPPREGEPVGACGMIIYVCNVYCIHIRPEATLYGKNAITNCIHHIRTTGRVCLIRCLICVWFQIEDAMLMFDKQTNRHRGKFILYSPTPILYFLSPIPLLQSCSILNEMRCKWNVLYIERTSLAYLVRAYNVVFFSSFFQIKF